MIYVAFTLGLFGSFHCIGMCGPLAIAFCNKNNASTFEQLISSLFYNIGRTITYSSLGLLFGLISSLVQISDFQKIISIILGVLLIISFLTSIDIDRLINKNKYMRMFYFHIRAMISKMHNASQQINPIQLGMINGLLPCGLVYLAIAGALTSGSILGGVTFMAMFGLGTIPMLFLLTIGISILPLNYRKMFNKLSPYATLFIGMILLFRGFEVNLPMDLNFWEAINNPILCH